MDSNFFGAVFSFVCACCNCSASVNVGAIGPLALTSPFGRVGLGAFAAYGLGLAPGGPLPRGAAGGPLTPGGAGGPLPPGGRGAPLPTGAGGRMPPAEIVLPVLSESCSSLFEPARFLFSAI